MLPKSLLAVDDWLYGSPTWCPSLAHSTPSTLQSLSLSFINTSSFYGTNWIAELPRSLTNLVFRPKDTNEYPFAPYVRFLPPGLLRLTLNRRSYKNAFGDWSTPSQNDWPSKLHYISLSGVCLDPRELAALPNTLQNLNFRVDWDGFSPLEQKLELPSGLTDLSMSWLKQEIDFASSLAHLPLTKCTLTSVWSDWESWPTWHKNVPSTLESLTLESIALSTPPNNDTIVNLPHLTSFSVCSVNYQWFKFLPRSLRILKIEWLEIRPDYESELDAPESEESDTQVFSHLPISLTELVVENIPLRLNQVALRPQELEHLQSLTSLHIDTCSSSKQLRKLPRSLKHLELSFDSFDLEDLPYLPEMLQSFTHIMIRLNCLIACRYRALPA